MIHIEFLGHIRTSMGVDSLDLPGDEMRVADLFGLLLSKEAAPRRHGFTKYNTLLVVNAEEAFSASAQEERRLHDGDSVLLVPFSHGG